jgi:hypothetical protein
MKRMLFALATLATIALPAAAQEVGRTEWNGYDVVLNADQSWYFDCGGYGATLSQTIRMAFCFDPAVWDAGEASNDQEFMFLSKDGSTGLIVIPDAQIYDMQSLHAAVPVSAAQNGQTTVEQINASEAPPVEINGRTWMGTRYQLNVEGNAFSYLDYHLSADGLGTAQLILWTLPGEEARSTERAMTLLSQVIYGN